MTETEHATGTMREVAKVCLPTSAGEFDARAYECPSGLVYLALTRGDISDGGSVLTRVHSECLTGDALGSLRCDCGVQLQTSLRAIAAAGRGVLVYATGQEGRGIGLVNKLRAYMEQDAGADTVDANLRLGLPVDDRTYAESAEVLKAVGVRSIKLLTNNPRKAAGLRAAGINVESLEPLPTASHVRNAGYLRTKQQRMGHIHPQGNGLASPNGSPLDVRSLLGRVQTREERPYVVLKYAQSLDGRIATTSGDSKWISGEEERRICHALRAACDAVLVGVGTVLSDDPQLTVRHVAGTSPLRVVLDSILRTPPDANVLGEGAPTLILTSARADAARKEALSKRRVGVQAVDESAGVLDIDSALATLRSRGVRSLLVEGGAEVITSMLGARVVDRLIVSVAPKVLGTGRDAVGDLRTERVIEGLELGNRTVHLAGGDVLLAWDVLDRKETRENERFTRKSRAVSEGDAASGSNARRAMPSEEGSSGGQKSMSDELAEKIFQRASNLGVTASTRYEGASTGEAVTELVQMAGGDAGVLKQASDMCDQALSTAPDNLDIKRGCELLSAAVDEAGSG